MTDFLIKSTFSLAVLLAVHHLVLEKEKMHQFNRLYLLFSLAFSLAIPFVTFEIIEEIAKPIQLNNTIQISQGSVVFVEETNYLPMIFWSVYGLITFLLSIRFIRNIIKIISRTKSKTVIDYKKAKLVLLEENVLPHTFLKFIFINETDYNNQKIETELFSHELTHVTQKHTFDILFIEILKTIFWFNPIFIFYKKAIQLNHEFLADEKVVTTYNNVSFYQNLLISKSNNNQNYLLTSNLNYSLTKKRLIMMTKTTSKTKAIFNQIALIPFIFGLVFFLCFKTVAQEKAETHHANNPTNEQITDESRDAYYAGVQFKIKDFKRDVTINKKYEELTSEEKDRYVHFVPKQIIEKSPTKKELESFKDAKKYAIWMDGVHKPNEYLSNFKPNDIAFFQGSSVSKNARSKKFPQAFQYNFYTHNYFDKNLKNSHKKFGGKEMVITLNADEKSKTPISGIEKYFEETIFTIIDEKGNRIGEKKFNELSIEERKHIPPPPAPTYITGNQTAQQIEDAKNVKEPKLVEINLYNKKQENSSTLTNSNKTNPEFPGGMSEFYKFVGNNFKVPSEIKNNGKIYISFMVETDGNLSEFVILRDIGLGTGDEAIRVLKLSPKWIPATENSKPIRLKYFVPIAIEANK